MPALQTNQPSAKSRLYYGWIMLPLSMAGVICTSPGQTYTVSVFNRSLREELDLTHTELTGAYMVATFLAALPLAYIGGLMDRFGPRITKTAVVLLFDAVELFRRTATNQFATFDTVVVMTLVKLPNMIEKMLPFSVMIAAMMPER